MAEMREWNADGIIDLGVDVKAGSKFCR